MAASSINDRWPKSTGAAPPTSDWFESPTLFKTQASDRMFVGPSSSLELVPGPNYDNIVSNGGNNRDHSENSRIFSPYIEEPPNMPHSIIYNSIYDQNTHAPGHSAIVTANSFASLADMDYDTVSNMSLPPFANAFKHPSTNSLNKNGPRNSGLLPRNNLKARSYRAPKLAEASGIKKTQKKHDGSGMSRLLKALNLIEQLKDVLKADGSCAMPISQLEELIGQTMIRETRASRASLTCYNRDWDIASEDHSVPSTSSCGDSMSNSNFSSYSQNDSSMTFLSSEQSSDDLDSMGMRMDMETPRAQPSTSIVYYCTFFLNGERCKFSAKSQVDWIKHEESEKHYPQKRYMCIMCIDLIDDEEGNSLCAFCFAHLPAMGNNKIHYLQCREAQKGRHVFAAARKDHFRNHLKKHGMLDITDESSTWIFDVESNWPRECGFCGATFETWLERKHHIANHFQQGMDISSWTPPVRKRKRLGDPRPGINYRRYDDDDDNDDDDENDQNNRPNNLHAPSNWISNSPFNTQPGSSSYTTDEWAGWGEAGSFDVEQPETSSREKVEAYLSDLPLDDTNETSHRIPWPTISSFAAWKEKGWKSSVTSPNESKIPPFEKAVSRPCTPSAWYRLTLIDILSLLDPDAMEFKEEHSFDRKGLWTRHENKSHALMRGSIFGADDFVHPCYGELRRFVATVKHSPSLSHLSPMSTRRLNLLRQILIGRYHYAMEKSALHVQSSLTNDFHHSFHLHSLERLLNFLVSRFCPQNYENIPRPFQVLFKDPAFIDNSNFPYAHSQNWATLIMISPIRRHDVKNDRILPIDEENEMVDATTALHHETKPKVGKDEVNILEIEFKKNSKPTRRRKRQFIEDMGVNLLRINNWFQTRHAKRRQEKKQGTYEAEQAQLGLEYLDPSSLDFYDGNGYFCDIPIQQSQAFPLINNGPPPAVAPYNPQHTSPSSASMESLHRILAGAQAASEHDEYPTLKKVVETSRDCFPSLINNSGDSAPKNPTNPSKSSSNCNDAVDRVELLHFDDEYKAPTPGSAGLRVRASQTYIPRHDHSNFYAIPVLGSNSIMLSRGVSTSMDTCVMGPSFSSALDISTAGLEDISIETRNGLVQSGSSLSTSITNCRSQRIYNFLADSPPYMPRQSDAESRRSMAQKIQDFDLAFDGQAKAPRRATR